MTTTGNAMNFQAATKTEADSLARELQEKHGGQWVVEKHVDRKAGTRWQVQQVVTRQELNKRNALNVAQMYTDPNFHPFNKDATLRFGNYYSHRDDLKASLDKWAARFAASPLNAFECGTDAVETAAEYDVICVLIFQHERGASLEDIVATIEDEARRVVEFGLRLSDSTSPMANLAERAKNNAYCKIARQLRSFIDAKNKATGDLWAYGEGLA